MFYSFKTPVKSILKRTSTDDAPNAPKRVDPKINPNQGIYIFQDEEKYQQTFTEPRDNQVHYLGVYTSRFIRERCREMMPEDYPFASAYSKLVRNLKSNKTEANRSKAVEFFLNMLLPLITHNNQIVIAAVPSSTPSKITAHGITTIASEIARLTNNIDGTKILTRTLAKKPCHKGGKMTKEAILQGLHIDAAQIKGRAVLLLDDVVKTGRNLAEIRAVLYELGASRVVCLALTGVLNKENQNRASQSNLEECLRAQIKSNQTLVHMQESLMHVFAAVNNAFPNSPQPEFLPLRRAKIKEASIEVASRINFDAADGEDYKYSAPESKEQDVENDDPQIASLVDEFSTLAISEKDKSSGPARKRVRFANGS